MNKRMAARITRYYDESMYRAKLYDYFGNSDFFNYGYWEADTPHQKAACENLMEKLLAFIPVKSGKILDVACGKGESSLFLTRYYEPSNITGINLSEKQLETCRQKVPDANFKQMDASRLDFPDHAFDAVMCLEAVFHFHTREAFLQEAHRVLKPGGHLLLTDILLNSWGQQHRLWWIDEANAGMSDLTAYEKLYQKLGYQGIEVMDATRECWQGYYTNLARYCCEKLDGKKFETAAFNQIAVNIFRKIPATQYYLLVAAQKG